MMNMNRKIVQIAASIPLRRCFDYLIPEHIDSTRLIAGIRVRIPFHKREIVGMVLEVKTGSTVPYDKLKPIIEVLDAEPIMAADIFQLCTWAADYYHHPFGEVLLGALPAWLRRGKPAQLKKTKKLLIPDNINQPLLLNSYQQTAFTAIQSSYSQFNVFLLDGVTGSGKTEVYLQVIADVLKCQQQILVLVPEIGLTPQTIQRFRERFAVAVIALHSGMTEKQRFAAWLAAKSGDAKIIIGTRSAVFTPFANLGLIIVDEEHDLSFKQQDSFRYHARDVAIMRAHSNNIPIVLGSATPSLETLHNARQARYQHLRLPTRAGDAILPQFHIIDIRHQKLENGLSQPLLTEMRNHLKNGDQVMLFLNRRGFAPMLSCPACGWMVKCKRCDIRMTYHYKAARLCCHHCESQKNIMNKCENCGATELQAIGQGTERLEETLKKHFENYSIARIDRDSTRRKGAMEEMLDRIHNGEHHILIGTQMLAKGHHFPNVTLVAIVDADGGFFSADFRALERMGQLLLQVSGRAGRDEKLGKVFIQTRQPDHPLLYQLLHEDYQVFSTSILQERVQAELPPYAFFALFRAEALKLEHAMHFLEQVKKNIELPHDAIQIMGPLAAPMPRRAGLYRVQLLLQSKQRAKLQNILKQLMPRIEAIKLKQRVRWSLDVDPLEIF